MILFFAVGVRFELTILLRGHHISSVALSTTQPPHQSSQTERVDQMGLEPTTSSMPWRRAANCATGPSLGEDKFYFKS